jgi:hypothetical protein
MGAITPNNNVEFATIKKPLRWGIRRRGVRRPMDMECRRQRKTRGVDGEEGDRITEPQARPGIHFPGSIDMHMLLNAVIVGLIACSLSHVEQVDDVTHELRVI